MRIFNVEVSLSYEKEMFSTRSIQIFFMSIIVGVLTATAQQVINEVYEPVTRFFSPVARQDVLRSVMPKLEKGNRSYQLQSTRSLIPASKAAADYDQAHAYVVVQYDTGEIIADYNSTAPVAIASLTKVMTAVVALDLAYPSDKFTVSPDAARMQPTKIGVVFGQRLTLEELLHALLMTSANDAAQVIREGVDQKYGEEVFIRAMNAKAKFIGLSDTSFDNPQGFDGSANYSSAEDLAVLTHYALQEYPLIAEIVQKDYYYLSESVDHKQFDLYNWNGLLGVYPNVKGVKIGNTDDAGKTTIVISERGGEEVLVVLLGASSVLERDMWTAQLLDVGFSEAHSLPKLNISEERLKEKYKTWKYW